MVNDSKSIKFKNCAKHIHDNKMDYNSAVNRYYYYVFRKARKIMEERFHYEPPEFKAHSDLRTYIHKHKKEILKKYFNTATLPTKRMVEDLPKTIEQVCTLREKADYEEKDITDDEMADVVKFIERIDIVLNKIAY